MAESKDRNVRFVAKLVQMTKEKQLNWGVISYSDAETGSAYVAKLEDRKLQLFKFAKETPNPRYAPYGFATFGHEEPKTIFRSGTILQICDAYDRVVYRFENVAGLSDLYEAAGFSAGKIDDLIDSVLDS